MPNTSASTSKWQARVYAIKSPYIVILLQSLGLNVPRPVSTLKGLPSTEKIKLITPYCCQILCKTPINQ